VVNRHQEPDLFWALKGGGGGTFGVITRLTLATHPLPDSFGIANADIHARSDEAFRRLLARFVDVYAAGLCNPHWGEQAQATPDNRLHISMVFQGLTQAQALAAWQPLTQFLHANAADYEGADSLTVAALPARLFWNPDFLRQAAPTAIRPDTRPGAAPSDFYWAGDADQVGVFWHAYTSAWLPVGLLRPAEQPRLVDAWFAASRHHGVAFHFNKGLAGADPAVIAASRDTATNPQALTAFALAIIADAGRAAGDTPVARFNQGRVNAAMTALRRAAPNAGAYVNECDYFQDDWQRAFWGEHYPRLLRIKRRYDPDGLFTVHHGVGSEAWSADGFTRTA
jgi:FAD/FMN-containing dehydrogenase